MAQSLTEDQNKAWQTVMDALGGGMSPLLMGQGLQGRTRNRLWDRYRSQGTGTGQNFLDYLTNMFAPA